MTNFAVSEVLPMSTHGCKIFPDNNHGIMDDNTLPTARLRKDFASLDDAKGRRRTGIFVAEGTKCVLELAAAFTAQYVYAMPEWVAEHGNTIAGSSVVPCAKSVLRQLTRLSTTPPVIAFFQLPDAPVADISEIAAGELYLALDRLQDPGNLGTIIRTADWLGVHTIYATPDTVDAFNPKTVQATMGSLARVHIIYTDIAILLAEASKNGIPVYGTFLDGDNIYASALTPGGIVVMGNEGRGISPEVEATVTRRLYIPPYPAYASTVESLNVATATAITLSQFRQRIS